MVLAQQRDTRDFVPALQGYDRDPHTNEPVCLSINSKGDQAAYVSATKGDSTSCKWLPQTSVQRSEGAPPATDRASSMLAFGDTQIAQRKDSRADTSGDAKDMDVIHKNLISLAGGLAELQIKKGKDRDQVNSWLETQLKDLAEEKKTGVLGPAAFEIIRYAQQHQKTLSETQPKLIGDLGSGTAFDAALQKQLNKLMLASAQNDLMALLPGMNDMTSLAERSNQKDPTKIRTATKQEQEEQARIQKSREALVDEIRQERAEGRFGPASQKAWKESVEWLEKNVLPPVSSAIDRRQQEIDDKYYKAHPYEPRTELPGRRPFTQDRETRACKLDIDTSMPPDPTSGERFGNALAWALTTSRNLVPPKEHTASDNVEKQPSAVSRMTPGIIPLRQRLWGSINH